MFAVLRCSANSHSLRLRAFTLASYLVMWECSNRSLFSMFECGLGVFILKCLFLCVFPCNSICFCVFSIIFCDRFKPTDLSRSLMSSKKSNLKNNNFSINIMLCSKIEQENFNRVQKVVKLMEDFPNMSLTTAIKRCNTTFPTYYKYRDLVERLKITELI